MGESKTNNSGIITVLLIIIFSILSAAGGMYIGKEKFSKSEEKASLENNQANLETEKNSETREVTIEEKQKIDEFIKVATLFEYGRGNTAEIFYKGTTSSSLTSNLKATMTYVKLLKFDKKYQTTYDIPQSVSNAVGGDTKNEIVGTVLIDDYITTYKSLFNEEPQISNEITIVGGCPMPVIVDKVTDKIYHFSRCGGTGPKTMNVIKNIDYSFDGENYIVTSVFVFNTIEEIENMKINKLTWKFDKNLSFISTVVE